jgi:DNA-binding LacI/PurR family transcriptional regulator
MFMGCIDGARGNMVVESPASELRAGCAYSQLVGDLRSALAAGELKRGDKVHGDVALSRQYGISVTSVRRGIDLLVQGGQLVRRQGSGTFVVAASPPAGSVPTRCDTVALLTHVRALTYHPYYSERMTGLREGLRRHGWQLWEPFAEETAGAGDGVDFGPTLFNRDRRSLWRGVMSRPGLAGMFVRGTLLPPDDVRPDFPMVTADATASLPCVAYDWRRELQRGFEHLISAGARRIWVLGVFPESLLVDAAARAARLCDVAAPELIIRATTNRVPTHSASQQHAYQLARADFEAGKRPADAILVTSDFEAQGVLDALREAGSDGADLPFLAILNRQTNCQFPPTLDRLIIDGHAQGSALAELLHAHITHAATAPQRQLLRAELETY